MGESPLGEKLGLSPAAIATTLTGMEWGVSIDEVMYDAEFTGQLTQSGKIEVKIKRKSIKQPKTAKKG